MEEVNHTIISNGETKITQPLTNANYENVVLALDRLLSEFAQQLSVQLHQLARK
jgi:hypothetical protein